MVARDDLALSERPLPAQGSGRGFMMNYAHSKPDNKNCFEVFELEDAIFQPDGGGLWDLHRYAGRQNIIR